MQARSLAIVDEVKAQIAERIEAGENVFSVTSGFLGAAIEACGAARSGAHDPGAARCL